MAPGAPRVGVLRDQAVLEETSQRKAFCKGCTRAEARGSQQVTVQPLQNWPRPINKLQLTERGGFQDKRDGKKPRGDQSLEGRMEKASWE